MITSRVEFTHNGYNSFIGTITYILYLLKARSSRVRRLTPSADEARPVYITEAGASVTVRSGRLEVTGRPPRESGVRPEKRASLRAPRPGSLADLRAAYDNGEQARSTDRFIAYGPPRPAGVAPEPVLDGPWSELLTFGLPPGRSLDGRLVVRVAIAWRSAVLTVLGEQFTPSELAAVHGHREAPGGQCAFLPLPFVGHEHADGEIRGLGLALPPDLDRPLRVALLRMLGMDADAPRMPDFHVPGLADPMPLAHGTFDHRVTVAATRWRPTRGARAWETALPLVLDRYPHRGEDQADHVRASCRFAGFPEPVDVEVLPASAVAGAPRLRSSDLRRRRNDPARPAVHARIVFPNRVRGPVVLGNLRHLGLGLCAPVAGT